MGDNAPVERVERRAEGARQRRRERRRQVEQRQHRARWMRLGLLGVALLVAASLGYGVYAYRRDQQARAVPSGVQTFSNLSRNHTQNPVSYPQTPPVGGDHAATWQNCGFYAQPVANENAVHSLEHGAVWITYRPDLPSDQVAALRKLAGGQPYVLVSPFPGLPAPVVALAWGKQLPLDSTSDPRLAQFVHAFRQGPQTPEPGAACSGGTSATH